LTASHLPPIVETILRIVPLYRPTTFAMRINPAIGIGDGPRNFALITQLTQLPGSRAISVSSTCPLRSPRHATIYQQIFNRDLFLPAFCDPLFLSLSLSHSLSLCVCVYLSFIPSALKRVIPKPRYRIPSRLAARRAADAALPAPRLYIYMPYLLNLLQFNFNKRTGWPACLSGANGKKRGQTRPRSSNYSRRDFRRPIRDAN